MMLEVEESMTCPWKKILLCMLQE
uniref:Uncharacterized protein n=1 Tax=Arundo donax TaxID=35708 RepID=A0A0A9GTG3_ARUDO